jgi:hypothetical protein
VQEKRKKIKVNVKAEMKIFVRLIKLFTVNT